MHGKLRRYFRQGTLIQLRVFEAVVRLGSYTRAGQELHMAQPTVSVHMKKLAETVGKPIVKQNGKRIRLTPAGEKVHAACHEIFRTLVSLDADLSEIGGADGARLRISTAAANLTLERALGD